MNLRNRNRDKKVKRKTIEFLEKTREYANLSLRELANPKTFSIDEKREMKRLEKERIELEKFISPYINKLTPTGKYGTYMLSLPRLRKKLYNRELYIDFAKTDKYYYLFTLNKKGQVTFKVLDGTVKDIDRLIEDFRTNIIDKKDTKFLGNRLYKLIFSKIKNLNRYKKLIISPDGLLILLPFEALWNNKKYLIEKKDISYLLSGRDLYKSRTNERYYLGKSYNREIVCFSYIDYDYMGETTPNKTEETKNIKMLFNRFTRLKPLLETKHEANFIKKTFPKNRFTSYSDKNATKEALYSLDSPQILHLSTHSFYGKDDNKSINSFLKVGLALSDFNIVVKYDDIRGLMSALDFSTLNLHDTELVFFSSCDSGVGEIYSSEGVSGLNKSARIAGADRVISTLWSVDENASLVLTEKFYTYLAKHGLKSRMSIPRRDKLNYSKALKETKLSMIKKYKHPFYWAGFVQYGLEPKLEGLNKYEYKKK